MAVGEHDEYAQASTQRDLAEDLEVAEQGIDIVPRHGCVVIRGEVESEIRRERIADKVRAHYPDREVRNDIVVIRTVRPSEAEDLP